MRLSFDFPANTAVLGKIGELAADAGREAGFSDVEIGDSQLAIDEACTNTIIHGLKKDPDRIFRLVRQWESDNIEILIHESGEPFDPENVRKPDTEACLDNRPIGGLGIYFVRKVMDEVEYRVDADGVKTLRMVKRKK